MPFDALLTEELVNQLFVPTFDSNAKFTLCHHEFSAIIAKYFRDASSSMNKTKKALKKRIRFWGASHFQVDSAGSHARENASVSLHMASLHLNKNRPEVVYSCAKVPSAVCRLAACSIDTACILSGNVEPTNSF